MKLIVAAILILINLEADKVMMNSIACEDINALTNINKEDANDPLKLVQYAAKNNCTILSPNDQVEVLEKLVANTKSGLALSLVRLKNTGSQVYTLKKNIYIEQPGYKNKFKF